MSNIYFKITVETLSKLQFLGLKNLAPGQFWGAPIHAVLKLLVATEKSDVWGQNYVWLFYYFSFKRGYGVLKSMHFIEHKYKL